MMLEIFIGLFAVLFIIIWALIINPPSKLIGKATGAERDATGSGTSDPKKP
jgi:hypothetical protein